MASLSPSRVVSMPNGYDRLFSEIRYVSHFLDYCEALVMAEEKLFSHLGGLHSTAPIRTQMLTILDQTLSISKHMEERIYPDIRKGIVEHNVNMDEVFRVHAAEAMRKEGIPDAEVNATVKGSIERTMIDFGSIDTHFDSINSRLSKLKEQVRALND